ncbi:hypothetical protein KAFR_0A01470 [Kazachstania africana CBS 2517]|uniref:BRCT domain-containing protein n=1 Tax=Kazachstania africana (strain ATCC 22294 / BCRC 22015 / CBS 2517 / CECT 1963 / NBRC 1671 / NRRL Y-8276) TaxID=1071382 RepID=H2AMI5_KAZAF|nr:hypothetical protein KAFR_0A01470 [Kazachstania africana CBS 2517]CCF55585.1 hypothetical protein KAFR_0A01470 [Kazachstania africana CBS 2517]
MKPFHDITFCTTCIKDETLFKSIYKKIIKLGGTCSNDLTRKVNVLIIGNSNDAIHSPKYKFAAKSRNDIIFIYYRTILELYQLWKSGNDITLQSHYKFKSIKNDRIRMLNVLDLKFSFFTLKNFYIFIGRIHNFHNIDGIQDLDHIANQLNCINCNSKDFRKDIKSNYPNSDIIFINDNLDGYRTKAAIELNIPIVHYKWLLDCQKRNAILQYDPYYLVENVQDKPFDKIGSDAYDFWDQIGEMKPTSLLVNESTTSHVNLTNKFKPQADKLWNRALSSTENSSVTRENKHNSMDLQMDANDSSKDSNRIFQNCIFQIHDKFPQKHHDILFKVITENEGIISTSDSLEPQYLIVPSNIPLDEIDLPKDIHPSLVTDFFIERCLHYKKLISPIDSWSKPFFQTKNFKISSTLNISNNQVLNISITGFYGVELLHLTKVFKILKPMGINFTEYLNVQTDVLLINISSLSSIPMSHPLWQNEYSDLFKQNLQNNNLSPVFRNSMKKKIEFIKNNHFIPVATPAFLMDIFKHTSSQYLPRQKPTVSLNNVNWCIMCPKGEPTKFNVKILPTNNMVSDNYKVDTTVWKTNQTTSNLKDTAKEVVSKIKSSSSSNPQRTKRNFSVSVKSEEIRIDPVIKRAKLQENKHIQNVKRSSSWGTMMSNETFDNNNDNHDNDDNSIQATAQNDSFGSHTQITYGSSTTTTSVPSKRLTRNNVKQLDL